MSTTSSITAVGTLDETPTKAQMLPVPIVGYTMLAAVTKNDMNKEFQVEQSYGQGSKGWVYFEIDESATEQEIINQAHKVVQSDWDKQYKLRTPSILFNPQPCRPTILIKEYKDGKSVRGGIKLKTRWR